MTFEGHIVNGQIVLNHEVALPEGMNVRVELLSATNGAINLSERGIDEPQAADLRERLIAFAEDWDRPEMDVYNAV